MFDGFFSGINTGAFIPTRTKPRQKGFIMSDFQALFLAALGIGFLIKTGELVGEIIVAIIKGTFSVIKGHIYLAFLKWKNKRRGVEQ